MTLLQNLQRIIGMKGSKIEVVALTGDLDEFAFAFSTGTSELGLKVNNDWYWYPTGTNPTSTDEKVKVSSNDTTAGYLNGKLIAGAGISLTENNNGSNETLTVAYTGTNCGTYQRVGRPIALSSVTGIAWSVPGYIYASGSLAVYANGSILTPDINYYEQFYVSGTYILNSIYATGTVFVAMWGVPCTTQIFLSTGSGDLQYGIIDSNDTQLVDSNDTEIVDSNG